MQMQAMPYNLQGKGVVEVSGIISQICSPSSAVGPKWKCLDRLHSESEHLQEEVVAKGGGGEGRSKEIVAASTSTRATSSIESEPTSTLDTTRRSPSPPTSTSTLSSSFTNGKHSSTTATATTIAAGVADPACGRKEDWPSGSVSGSGSGSRSCSGSDNVTAPPPPSSSCLEDWDTMFPTGDGALLPWIIGDAEDPSLGLNLKHLLQSGGTSHHHHHHHHHHHLDYEGNAGLGVVDQASDAFQDHSQHEQEHEHEHEHPLSLDPASHSAFLASSEYAKIGSLMSPNCSSGLAGLNSGSSNGGMLLGGSLPGAAFNNPPTQPLQFDFGDDKPQIFNPQLVMNPQQAQTLANPSFLLPPFGYCQLDQHLIQPPTKRHNPGVVLDPNLLPKNSFLDQGHDFLLRKQQQQQQQHQVGFQQLPMGGMPPQMVPKPMMGVKQNHQQHFPLPVLHQQQQLQEQAIKDLLFNAADHILTGNFSLAQEILARLNHQLSLPAKPLIRAALYVQEALQMLLMMGNPVAAPPSKTTLTPYDVVHKMNAYKVFSEVSPFTQFMNFTCTQVILEALDDADAIHIIDFDIGCGAQWASLIQELPLRKRGAPSLKITAFVPLSTTHHFELGLIRDNLVQFANDIGVAFDLQVANLDSFDPSSCSMPNLRSSEDEAIAVSIPIWASSNRPSVLLPILEFIKQCSPKIVVSLDRGFDRCDVPFPQHLVHTLDSCTNFLESLDGLNVASDIVNKVEKFFVQPKIENTILGRVHYPEKMPHWKNLFASAGFSPVQFSNFTETQADYVVKRTPARGFHVEKRQASLLLSWQRRELVAASAWRC